MIKSKNKEEFEGSDGNLYSWLDSDTITDGATSYRVKGFNGLETSKVIEDDEGKVRFIQGQRGGDEQTNAIKEIARVGGFNNVDIGDDEEDIYGRKLAVIRDRYGNDLSNTAYRAGLMKVNRFTNEQGIKAEQYGEMEREAGLKNEYTDIAQKELPQGKTYFKDSPILEQAFGAGPIDENSYAQQVIQVIANQKGLNLNDPDDMRQAAKILDSGSYDKRSVAFMDIGFRSPDRTREGVAYNQMSTAWNQGWGGMATGLAGFAELSGVMVGSGDLANWSKRRVEMAKEDLLEAPRLKNMDYRDIDSVWDGFGYVTNNMAMSAPYLVALTSGALLAPITGGASIAISVGSIGGSYAGQVWNDIEGPKGRAEAAGSIVAGTAMAALDYLGMKGFMKPGEFLTKAGKAKIASAMVAQGKARSIDVAEELIKKSSRKAIGEVIDGMGGFALMNVAKPQLMREMARGSIRGAATEGTTEALQEGTGYLSSKAMSEGGLEKNFNADEFKNLLAQSAVAGSSLGAGFGAGGALFREGQNKILRADLETGNLSKMGEFSQIRAENKPKSIMIDGREVAFAIPDILAENKAGVGSKADVYKTDPDFNRLEKVGNTAGKEDGIVIGGIATSNIKPFIDRLTQNNLDINKRIKELNAITSKTPEQIVEARQIRVQRSDNIKARQGLENEQKKRDKGVEPLSANQIKEQEDIKELRKIEPKATSRPDSVLGAIVEEGKQRKATEKSNRSTWDKLKNFKKYLPLSYRASSTSVFSPALLRKSEGVRKMASVVGTALGNIYSGVNASGYFALLKSKILEKLNPRGLLKAFNMSDTQKNYNTVSNLIREYVAADKTQPLSPELIKYQSAIELTITNLNASLQMIYDEEFNLESVDNPGFQKQIVNKVTPQWLNSGTFDWKKVRQNKASWIKFMKTNARGPDGKPYLDPELDILYNKISNNEDASDFSIVTGNMWRPNDFRQANGEPLSALNEFKDFANTDVIQNQVKLIDQYSKYIAYTGYYGRGGQDLDFMLGNIIAEGTLTEEELQDLAMGVKDIVDSDTGNYNPIENKELAFWQRKASWFSAIIGLPLSALASVPEYAMILFQGPETATVRRGIVKAIKEMTGIIKNIENMPQNPANTNVPAEKKSNKAMQRLSMFGLFPDDAVAATRLGMGETDIAQAWWMKQFFKYTLIAPQTTFQRATVAALVGGVVSDGLRILDAVPLDPDTGLRVPMNQRQLEKYNQLADIGLDVDAMVAMFARYRNPEVFDILYEENTSQITDPIEKKQIEEDSRFIKEQMAVAGWYFTNERIQNPQAFNRPLIFQDPHYQLFLQFNGFISNFTSVIIPKLWIDYLKNGSPRMKYNTFALIVMMMALAGLSQWLKDYIKFGKSSPYLNDFQLVQRAMMASGILGSGERLLQAGIPLYQSRDENVLSRIFGESVGGAPVVRNLITAGKSLGYFAEGDTRKGVGTALKVTPGVAPFTPGRNILNQIIHGDKLEPY